MIITHNINGYCYLMIEVTPGAYDFEIQGNHLDYFKFMTSAVGEVDLPPGDYLIVNTGNRLEAYEIANIVKHTWDGTHHWYKDYLNENIELKSITKSFESLLAHYKLKPETTLVVYKKNI